MTRKETELNRNRQNKEQGTVLTAGTVPCFSAPVFLRKNGSGTGFCAGLRAGFPRRMWIRKIIIRCRKKWVKKEKILLQGLEKMEKIRYNLECKIIVISRLKGVLTADITVPPGQSVCRKNP